MVNLRRRAFAAGSAAFALAAPSIVSAQKKYDPGVTDKEIKLGHTNPYSGPLSAYGTIGKAMTSKPVVRVRIRRCQSCGASKRARTAVSNCVGVNGLRSSTVASSSRSCGMALCAVCPVR